MWADPRDLQDTERRGPPDVVCSAIYVLSHHPHHQSSHIKPTYALDLFRCRRQTCAAICSLSDLEQIRRYDPGLTFSRDGEDPGHASLALHRHLNREGTLGVRYALGHLAEL